MSFSDFLPSWLRPKREADDRYYDPKQNVGDPESSEDVAVKLPFLAELINVFGDFIIWYVQYIGAYADTGTKYPQKQEEAAEFWKAFIHKVALGTHAALQRTGLHAHGGTIHQLHIEEGAITWVTGTAAGSSCDTITFGSSRFVHHAQRGELAKHLLAILNVVSRIDSIDFSAINNIDAVKAMEKNDLAATNKALEFIRNKHLVFTFYDGGAQLTSIQPADLCFVVDPRHTAIVVLASEKAGDKELAGRWRRHIEAARVKMAEMAGGLHSPQEELDLGARVPAGTVAKPKRAPRKRAAPKKKPVEPT